jgi:hypothetical protein
MDANAMGAMTMSNDGSDRIESTRTGSAAGRGAAAPIDYAQRVLKAQDLAEVIRLHRELELRLSAFTKQGNELRQISRVVRSAALSLKT